MKVTKASNIDLVTELLETYRERLEVTPYEAPTSYAVVKEEMENLISKKLPVIVEVKTAYAVQTSVMHLTKAYNRWATGYAEGLIDGEVVKIPQTIHYSDILCKKTGVKTISKGMLPDGF
ncbi:hypothetical protein BPS13_0178 [Bacillus phage BPS13]|uniref:Uncharacterized protein n=3 Tax=Wphvirus TaxID=1922327 RepID=W5QUQ8_9CAUD|nr:hypothetical protein [Bacillus thuringiensis]YP_006907737.1 hypothetical protein BPS13_0178 [Bacillus phage BPS13]YP_009003063.1 hypothetical protein BPS10C_177 [Bacillus phage BPS10C]YP_009282129.1 hypothetical protein SALINJAH_175 [Bacillus phage SalinJah]AEZ50357.1 hypothetical protein BPS13_0178 [Bacillus phage BPS13]AGI12174.1 hypothetical protein BPS10C_177 [Bacillus phage BPS10C]ANH50626.1 hypothetical protein SALINJAH_175 [Bacillus phage SalinJah]OTZ47843.1 hypothetical protein BK